MIGTLIFVKEGVKILYFYNYNKNISEYSFYCLFWQKTIKVKNTLLKGKN